MLATTLLTQFDAQARISLLLANEARIKGLAEAFEKNAELRFNRAEALRLQRDFLQKDR